MKQLKICLNIHIKQVLIAKTVYLRGYHVSLQVNLENKKMIAVPSKSIVAKGDDAFVYVEDKGKLRKQNVKKVLLMGTGQRL